jgi:Fe-Mn family superoxide dismutase
MQKIFNNFYGSFDKWKEDFTACATSARGWCILAYEQRTARCRDILLDVHDEGQIATAFPIIIIDMYEHAYFLDYGIDKASYIKRFIDNIPWDVIEKRAGLVV